MDYKVQLDEEHAREFIKHIYRQTLPAMPHEAEIIRNVLQTNHEQNDWRTARHVFCTGCHRETTVLDLFLSGLNHHSPKYIHDFLFSNGPGHGEVAFQKEGLALIEIFRHRLRITCTNCGVTTKDHFSYFYVRPKLPTPVIAVSEEMFDKFHALAREDVLRRHS